jgi:oligopeptide/dipeptide ABC transporter ATP-binding protein
VLDLIQGIARKSGIAVLLITHDLGVVARYADRVSVMYAGRVVEQAAADVLFANPLHPYTQGLLASVPRVDRTGSGIHPIRGNPPDASRLPTGCAFRERCDKAISECATQMPVIEVHDGSAVACWVASNEHQHA